MVPPERKPEIYTAERKDASRVEALAKRRKELAPPFSRLIFGGYDLTVGLKSDGTVIAAGEDEESRFIAKDWTDIVAICAGTERTLGLRANGTVVASPFTDGHVDRWCDIVAISVGEYHAVGLKKDGTVIAAVIDKQMMYELRLCC